jgi:hypothetical protein
MLWRDFDAGLDALLGCVPSYVQRVCRECNCCQQVLMYNLGETHHTPYTGGDRSKNDRRDSIGSDGIRGLRAPSSSKTPSLLDDD